MSQPEVVDLRSWRDRIGLIVVVALGGALAIAVAGWVYWTRLREPPPAEVCEHLGELARKAPADERGELGFILGPLAYRDEAPPDGDGDERCQWLFQRMQRLDPDYPRRARCIVAADSLHVATGCAIFDR